MDARVACVVIAILCFILVLSVYAVGIETGKAREENAQADTAMRSRGAATR